MIPGAPRREGSPELLPDPHTFVLFLGTALAFLFLPGPSILYVVARSVHGGRSAGVASVAGLGLGDLAQVVAATLGLLALLASSSLAFSAVRWLGAAYLIWLGVRTLLARDAPTDAGPEPAPEPLRRVFRQGFVVNALNPKSALFFLAFLPQFVDRSAGAAWSQVLALGVSFVALGAFVNALYALAGGTAGGWMRRRGSSAASRAQRWVAGGVYLAFGVATVASGSGED